MDPSGPSQPTQQTSYNQPQNPSSQTTTEQTTSTSTSGPPNNDAPIDRRSQHDVPSTHSSEATSTSLGAGDTGPLKERSIPSSDAQGYSAGDSNLEGEQMRAPGEGDIANAVQNRKGGFGEQGDLAGGLDRKEREHDEALERRGELEKEDWTGKGGGVDVRKALGGRGTAVVAVEGD